MIPDFYLTWTWQRNCIKAVHILNSVKTIQPSFFPFFSIRKAPLRQCKLCGCFSVSLPKNCYVPARRDSDPSQHVLSSCASQHNHAFQFTPNRHDCPGMTCGLREAHPTHWGTQRLSSSSLLEVPRAFQSCSSLVEALGNNCNANTCHCQVGIALECNNSCTHLRHLLQHWQQLTCDRIQPYNNPVNSLSFYNLVPSGAWHRESLTWKAIYSKCWGCKRKRKLKVKQKTKTPAGGNATANIHKEGKLLSPNIGAGNEIRSSWSLITHWEEQTGIQMSWRKKQGFMKYFWQVWKNKSHSIWQM